MIKIVWIENRIQFIYFAQLYNYQVCVGQVDFSMIGTKSATSREIWHSRLIFSVFRDNTRDRTFDPVLYKSVSSELIQKKKRKSSSSQRKHSTSDGRGKDW